MGRVVDLQNVKSRHLPLLTGNRGLKRQGGAFHLEIGALVFRCPITRRDIESGIEMDRRTFLRIGKFSLQLRCPACRHLHEFKVANGHLAPFTVSIAGSASNSPSATEAPDRQNANREATRGNLFSHARTP